MTTNDLPAAVGIITAMARVMTHGDSDVEMAESIAPMLRETWEPDNPLGSTIAVATVAVRLAWYLGEATGRDVFEVLAELGAEALRPPEA